MNVLLIGGNAAIHRSVVQALTASAHRVRVLAHDARASAAGSRAQVEPWAATIEPSALDEASKSCDAAIVLDRSVSASADAPVERSADPVQRGIDAARRAGVRRLILVSADDAPAGDFPDGWTTIRTSPVYGIGDDPITLFLIMMRSLPAVPVLSEAHVLRPLWHEDLARVLAATLSRPASDLDRVVHLAGPDPVTQRELYDRIAMLIDRRPARVPVPDFLAEHGARIAEALRMSIPFEASHLAFARAGTEESGTISVAPFSVLGVAATSLNEGLKRLINELEELRPLEGVGALEVKRFSADIRGSRYGAADLLRLFRSRFKDVMPIDVGVEPASPQVELAEGGVIAMALPGRGHVQVRVEEVADRHVVVATLRGHVLAGIVRFGTRALDDAVRFEVMTCDAAANALDWITLTLGGARIQDANWTKVVQNVVALSGGTSDGVQSDARKLDGEEAANVQRWIDSIVQHHRRSAEAAAHGKP